jgi:hypothetical protein
MWRRTCACACMYSLCTTLQCSGYPPVLQYTAVCMHTAVWQPCHDSTRACQCRLTESARSGRSKSGTVKATWAQQHPQPTGVCLMLPCGMEPCCTQHQWTPCSKVYARSMPCATGCFHTWVPSPAPAPGVPLMPATKRSPPCPHHKLYGCKLQKPPPHTRYMPSAWAAVEHTQQATNTPLIPPGGAQPDHCTWLASCGTHGQARFMWVTSQPYWPWHHGPALLVCTPADPHPTAPHHAASSIVCPAKSFQQG